MNKQKIIKDIDIAIDQKNYDLALQMINRLDKNGVDLLLRQTRIFYEKEDFQKALEFIEKVNQLVPEKIDLRLLNLDIAIKAKNIIKSHSLIIDLKNKVADHDLRGFEVQFYKLTKNYKMAVEILKKAIGNDTEINQELFIEIGYLLNLNQNFKEALDFYNKAIELNDRSYAAYYNRGISYANLNRHDDSIESFYSALDIDSSDQQIYQELAAQYQNKNDLIMAEKILDSAINKFHDNANLKCIKAFLYILKKDKNSAIDIYDQVIQENPEFIRTYCDKSYLLLANGDYKDGWNYYQYRQLVPNKTIVSDRDVLQLNKIEQSREVNILPEQGIGDLIFHSRLLQKLKIENKVNVYTDARLIKLFEENFNNINFIDKDLYKYDEKNININIASLARFYIKNNEDIYFKNYRIKKSQKTKNNIIGISWMSGNAEWGQEKSIPLDYFRDLKVPEKINLYNLQYGEVEEDIASYNINNPKNKIINENAIDKFNDIYRLSQIIQDCAFVVTVSNVTAHIAGALGKKCYLLLPKHLGKMWYWQSQNMQSIWYPSVTVIPQENNETWKNSIEKLNDLLRQKSIE